jgi:hypothetical protein
MRVHRAGIAMLFAGAMIAASGCGPSLAKPTSGTFDPEKWPGAPGGRPGGITKLPPPSTNLPANRTPRGKNIPPKASRTPGRS